ncbi:unnamed protein product [Calypogeia fissa]
MEPEDAPYSVKLHQADAAELAKSGAILLILNVPPGTSFGFNTQMFVVGPNFLGVKMLLPGPHFVYYSSRSRHGGDSSPVTGFFIYASPSQVIVREWDIQEERLVKLKDSSEEERYELAARRMEFDRQLAPYNLDRHKNWQFLSNFISLKVISRIEPVEGDISVMAEAAVVQQAAKTPAERRMYEQIAKGREQLLQKMSGDNNDNQGQNKDQLDKIENTELPGNKKTTGRCFYTLVPHFVKQTGMAASELTALNMDKSQLLELVIGKEYEGEEELFLGELQFCFIAFLMGQSLESFGQWKTLVSLLLRCEDAPLKTRTILYVKFLKIIYWQLKQGLQPEDKSNNPSAANDLLLDDSWLLEDNFLKLLFKDFFNMLRDASPVDGELLRQASRLRNLVEKTLGWIFDVDNGGAEEDDEYAPVVVDQEDLMRDN